MKKIDIISIAFSNFKRRKTRSVLTVLGVVIGVASIVIMVSLGIAVNLSFDQQMQGMGDLTNINVSPGFDNNTGQQTSNLDDELIAKLKKLPNVKAVSPQIRINGKLVIGKYTASPQIIGIDTNQLDALGFEVEQGNLEDIKNVSGKNIFCLMGNDIPYQFHNPRKSGNHGGMMMGMSYGMMGGGGGGDGEAREPAEVAPMDETTKMKFTFDWSYGEKKDPSQSAVATKPKLYPFKTSAILKNVAGEKNYNVYIDIEQAKKLKKEQAKYEANQNPNGGGASQKKQTKQTYDNIIVIVDDVKSTGTVTDSIKAMGFQAWGNASIFDELKKFASILQLILGGIGSISLIVAAIGITNTMVMSIYERTREIGVMKVIGCQLKDIRSMFLYEAAFIGLFGGAVGLLISYGASYLLNLVGSKGGGLMGMMGGGGGAATKLSVIPPWLALGAVIFAIMVGLLSGFLPARRAMKLSALEAMRT